MNIALDIRMLNNSGIGTVLKHLLKQYAIIEHPHKFTLISPPEYRKLIPENLQPEFIDYNKSLYGITGQIFYPGKIHSDILHYPHYNIPLKFSGRMIANVHDLAHFHYPGNFLHKHYMSFFINQIKKRKIRLITGSNHIKNELVNLFKFNPDMIKVIYHAVDIERFSNKDETKLKKFREKYSLPEKYLLAVGINKPHKNFEFLFRVLKRKEFNNIPFIYCSPDGKTLENLKQRQVEGEFPKGFHVIPGLLYEEIPLLYQNSAAFIFPSLYEGFGLPPLEAMAAGIPVISSNSQPMPEILEDAPEYFNPEDEESCATAILKILENSEKRKEVIENGYRVVQKFSWRISAEKTIKEYENCIL